MEKFPAPGLPSPARAPAPIDRPRPPVSNGPEFVRPAPHQHTPAPHPTAEFVRPAPARTPRTPLEAPAAKPDTAAVPDAPEPVREPEAAESPEPVRAPEVIKNPAAEAMRSLITVAEKDMMAHTDPAHGHPGRMGGRELGGFCRPASHVLEHYAKQENGCDAATYQVRDIHDFFNNGDADPEQIREAAFGHAATVAKIDDEVFLGDLTFGQFCDGDTICQSPEQDTGIPSTDPLAQRLVEDCYVPLTDETLRDYLRLTTGAEPEDTGYIERATVDELLANVTPLEPIFSDDEIASGAMWHGVPCTEQPWPCTRPDPVAGKPRVP